jgi:beta-lactamase class A
MEASPGVKWGVCVRAGADLKLESDQAGDRLATASIGKVLLLVATARLIADGELDPSERLDRRSALDVADSGVWQHLDQGDLAVSDLAALVGLASDNLATNVLLNRVGFEAVDEVRSELGLTHTRLNDFVRDVRTQEHPPALSEGSATELLELFERLREPSGPLSEAQRMTVGWLKLGSDLSMVASAFNLDPLARTTMTRGFTLVNKTGTAAGVRADVGFACGSGGPAAYAVIANWDGPELLDDVMAEMRDLGIRIRAAIS